MSPLPSSLIVLHYFLLLTFPEILTNLVSYELHHNTMSNQVRRGAEWLLPSSFLLSLYKVADALKDPAGKDKQDPVVL